MKLVNFNDYPQNQRMYGGTAGRKMGITYEGKDYLLKFPGNLKEQQMKNINLSYSNSPVCEYIGSKIYELVGLPVHHTILGTRNEKIVVACEDFLGDGDRLYEFDKIKVTFEPHFLDSNGNETNGVGVDLYEIMMTIQEHPFLKDISGVKEHFWNMFVMDALIGNTDRNNSNWGIILRKDGLKEIAPVYDNGNCLNNKWDDEKMQIVMNDTDKMEAEAYKARRCIFELHGKRVNPYHIMESMEYQECSEAIRRLTPKIGSSMNKIQEMIKEIPVISEIQKQFFTSIIEYRYENVLLPVCKRIMEKETGCF
ncbi:MAG: HipA domain-containing protein [Lachnospiraceae bacterium]|nr:HipA domain-containing protein [Lachnospiraceae bacterium]MDD7378434.1 HipA domain-containing protein [Lachnospiraceae bacterium]MDY4616558.1 HipA domain-containing protein [Lachnospiraceae bacterium]